MENIKDFLLTSEDIAAAKEQKEHPSKVTEYIYSVETSTDTDIVIKKESKTGRSSYKLVLLMSEGLYYILKPKGKTEKLTRLSIRNFFRQYYKSVFETGHPIWDSFNVKNYYSESTEQAILFMAQSDEFYTGLNNSYIPLSCCASAAFYEGYKDNTSYGLSKKAALEEKLRIFSSEIGRYTIQKIMEKESKSKKDVLLKLCKERVNSYPYSEKECYKWAYSAEQMECFYNIWRIWPAEATKFVDSWIASDDCSLNSDCIAHVIFAWYVRDIENTRRTCERIENYINDKEKLAYPFNREADKFIRFLFEEPKKYYMDDRLIRWCELWCQDIGIQKELYNEIKEPYPENLLVHAAEMHKMARLNDKRRKEK